jgi:hypothetical protein
MFGDEFQMEAEDISTVQFMAFLGTTIGLFS